jgi:hypothetical protein
MLGCVGNATTGFIRCVIAPYELQTADDAFG